FQAEDGIRDFHVTGVQTCALPISCEENIPGTWITTTLEQCSPIIYIKFGVDTDIVQHLLDTNGSIVLIGVIATGKNDDCFTVIRSEERRVGKGCRARWGPTTENKK